MFDFVTLSISRLFKGDICIPYAIGLSSISYGEIVNSYFTLINVDDKETINYIKNKDGFFAQALKKAPVFSEAWNQISSIINNSIIVVHFSASDYVKTTGIETLKSLFEKYSLVFPDNYFVEFSDISRYLSGNESSYLQDIAEEESIHYNDNCATCSAQTCSRIIVDYCNRTVNSFEVFIHDSHINKRALNES
jgi:DNA polymerase III epsilon subunit-like protein